MCHQVEATKEGQFHGGHSFALERLLYVFWQLLRLQGVDGPEEQSADIFTQLSSLVSLRFLSQVACQLAQKFVDLLLLITFSIGFSHASLVRGQAPYSLCRAGQWRPS